mgnify:CR=1 FL=1
MSPDPRAGLAPTGPAASDVLQYRRVLAEVARRQIEALRLYEPLPGQEEFHACRARRRLLRAGNRAGKTLVCAVEAARCLTGRDPHNKFPTMNGRLYAVGKDESQLGEVLHRKLFRAGAFKVIRDLATGLWRAFRPWLPADQEREDKAKPAPPLIPERFIKHKSWVKKAAFIPEKFTLVNGWEIDFWSSNSAPPRGSDLDAVWMDEEIINPEWYAEMAARLLDRKGSLWWGATPQSGSVAMTEFHLRCEREEEEWRLSGFDPKKVPDAREIVISLADNAHLGRREKELLAADLTEEQARTRIDGEYAVLGRLMYPEYHPRCHDIPYFGLPPTWTRYAITDPGRQTAAVLFGCVPPKGASFPVGVDPVTREERHVTVEFDDEFVLLYDELYILQCNALMYGERMKGKCRDQTMHTFGIDRHGSRIVDLGSGKDVETQYSEALKANGVKCTSTGSRFTWCSDDVKGGEESARFYLYVRAARALPRIFTLDAKNRLPNFKWEIERFSRKVDPQGNITDESETRGRVHLMQCLRYLCAMRPKYHEPKATDPRMNFAVQKFLSKQRRRQGAGGGSVILGPDRS